MRCPVCNFEIGRTNNPPLDLVGDPIFLWDQVYLGDSDDDDTEAYVIEILSEVSIRVLIPTGREHLILEVWDIPADSAHKLHDPEIHYANYTDNDNSKVEEDKGHRCLICGRITKDYHDHEVR